MWSLDYFMCICVLFSVISCCWLNMLLIAAPVNECHYLWFEVKIIKHSALCVSLYILLITFWIYCLTRSRLTHKTDATTHTQKKKWRQHEGDLQTGGGASALPTGLGVTWKSTRARLKSFCPSASQVNTCLNIYIYMFIKYKKSNVCIISVRNSVHILTCSSLVWRALVCWCRGTWPDPHSALWGEPQMWAGEDWPRTHLKTHEDTLHYV